MKGMVGIFDSQILCFSDSSQMPTRNLRSLQIYSKTRISTVCSTLYLMKDVYWAIYCSLAKTVTVIDVCCDDRCGI